MSGLLTPSKGGKLNTTHYVGGRGSGKTVAGIVKLFLAATALRGRGSLAWTEPSYGYIEEILWRNVENIIPRDLWRRHDGGRRMTLCGTNVDLISRNHRNSHADIIRGPTYAGIIHDEMAMDASDRAWLNSLGAIRGTYNIPMFVATVSNPKCGWYQHTVQGNADADVIYCKTSENPYNGDLDSRVRAQVDARFAARELDAQWISDTNALYPDWVEDEWPNGNRHPHIWNPQQPWQLWVDPGVVKSAWLVVQSVDDWTHPGQLVDVVVAEVMARADGQGAKQVSRQVRAFADKEAGKPNPPMRIVYDPAGNARNVSDSSNSVRKELAATWGDYPTYQVPTERSKEAQLTIVRGRVCNTFAKRQFCASMQLISDGARVVHDPHRPGADSSPSKRGVLEVMREFALPDSDAVGDIAAGKPLDVLLSDKRLEHANDAIMYGNAVNHRLDSRMTYYSEAN